MKNVNSLFRLLALALALCVLCGCGILTGGSYSEEQLIGYLEELEEQLEEAEPGNAVPQEPMEEPAQPDGNAEEASEPAGTEEDRLDPDGSYTSKEDVARYLYEYGELPGNFITKNEARERGWNGGGLDEYAYGMCIGGDRFGNYEGLLPEAAGREYHECDIDTLHASGRGAKRIVYSNDGLIYYTDDHYESFTLLYPED